MGGPDFVRRADRDPLNPEIALRIIRELEANGPIKPWTVLSRIQQEREEIDTLRAQALKPLTLKGYVTPNADGDLRVDGRMDFREDYLQY